MDVSKVTRFEVIDHRMGSATLGRAFVAWKCAVELSLQDGARTLKVFVQDNPANVCSVCRRPLLTDDDGGTIWHEHACE